MKDIFTRMFFQQRWPRPRRQGAGTLRARQGLAVPTRKAAGASCRALPPGGVGLSMGWVGWGWEDRAGSTTSNVNLHKEKNKVPLEKKGCKQSSIDSQLGLVNIHHILANTRTDTKHARIICCQHVSEHSIFCRMGVSFNHNLHLIKHFYCYAEVFLTKSAVLWDGLLSPREGPDRSAAGWILLLPSVPQPPFLRRPPAHPPIHHRYIQLRNYNAATQGDASNKDILRVYLTEMHGSFTFPDSPQAAGTKFPNWSNWWP